ncbi:cryptococcal mannosyltransferase 1-domain-containing protein [Mycena vitilis]|nr:cryptococcal mannosyltransferase 1-domain-containing protein [Mycena vitilis]
MSRWPASILHLPSSIFRRTAHLCVHHPHSSISLASFVVLLGLARLSVLILLGRGFPAAFPESRAFFVATLVTVPLWGLCMCLFYLIWVFWPPLQKRWRGGRQGGQYTELVFDVDELGGEEPVPRHTSRPRLHLEWNFRLIVLWLPYLFLVIFGLYLLATYELAIDHRFKPAIELANRVHKKEGYGAGEKIFIAAMFYNNADVVPYWTTEITKLIHYLGPDNVFVSIAESYSTDSTPALLRTFDKTLEKLGVPRRILTQDTSLVRPPSMLTALPRVEFLAAVRNLAIEPLVERGGYDRLLFSNDVFIEAESIVELLNTQDGEYDMACGLDFGNRGLYDLWVLRDHLGHLVSALYPYFVEDLGFRAVMADTPAPVFACWNGIVSVRAEPFLPLALRGQRNFTLSTDPLAPLPPSHPLSETVNHAMTPALAPPLRFRASTPSECFSSESFLLPYDLRVLFFPSDMRMYANPLVISAYARRFYFWFKYVLRHWAVRWFMDNVEHGRGVHLAKFILGDAARVWRWDGGECHPGPW